MQLRLARNKDGNQIINLIKRCFKDYKNCYLDVDNDSPELRDVYSYFKNKKGKFWVYVDKNKISNGQRGPITKILQSKYSNHVRGENILFPEWLTNISNN